MKKLHVVLGISEKVLMFCKELLETAIRLLTLIKRLCGSKRGSRGRWGGFKGYR